MPRASSLLSCLICSSFTGRYQFDVCGTASLLYGCIVVFHKYAGPLQLCWFLLCSAHKETSVRLRLVASKAAYDTAKAMKQPVDKSSVYGHTRTLFDNAKAQMLLGKFQPVLDKATLHCMSKLPWWQPSGSSSTASSKSSQTNTKKTS